MQRFFLSIALVLAAFTVANAQDNGPCFDCDQPARCMECRIITWIGYTNCNVPSCYYCVLSGACVNPWGTTPCSSEVADKGRSVKLDYTDADARDIAAQSPRFAATLLGIKNASINEGGYLMVRWKPVQVTREFLEHNFLNPDTPAARQYMSEYQRSEGPPPRPGVRQPSIDIVVRVEGSKLTMRMGAGARDGELREISIPLKEKQ